MLQHIKFLKKQGIDYEKAPSLICKSIADIEKENEFLSSSVYAIEAFATKCHHQFAKSLLKEAENISKSDRKIDALKNDVEQTKQTKIQMANENAMELICEEEANATYRREKMRQRLPKTPTFFHDAQHESEESVSDDETMLNTFTLIDPELQKLGNIDEQVEDLARTLKSKTDNLIKFIQGRLTLKIPLPSSHHSDIYSKIN